MSAVAFAGNMYADKVSQGSGDRNNLANYEVTCSCGLFLGFVASYRENADGERSAYCAVCGLCTILQGAAVKSVSPYVATSDEEKAKLEQIRAEALRKIEEQGARREAFLKSIRAGG